MKPILNWIRNKWKEFDAPPEKIRSFGLILSLILFSFGVLSYFRGHHHYKIEWPLGVAIFFLTFAAPRILSYVYRVWMMVAERISWVLLRILLGILFYVVISPISVVNRLRGNDLLDQKIDPSRLTYWKKKTRREGIKHYEQLF